MRSLRLPTSTCYCSVTALRGPTTTRRSGSSPMLELVTSGSPSSARWMARRSNACMASRVIASPVIFTWRAARSAISRTVCSRRWRYRSTSTMTRSPSSRCLPTITFVTDCRARSVSPRQPINAPRSRPVTSSVIGSLPARTCTEARTPMCLRSPSSSVRTVSALPFTGDSPAGADASITVTSTTVSSGFSLTTLTSTLRRVSPSSIRAASTASSRVRPRPSADLIVSLPSSRLVAPACLGRAPLGVLCILVLPPTTLHAPRQLLRVAAAAVLGRTGSLRLADRRLRAASLGPEASPPDHEVLLNDTDAVADEPVEPEAGRNLQGEVPDHQRRHHDHHSLHLLGLQLLLRGVRRRRRLQHLRLHEGGGRREQREDQVGDGRDRQPVQDRHLGREGHQGRHEQEVRRLDVRVPENPVKRRQHRDLDDQRKAAHQPAERVDAVLLVELHHLGVQLLRVLAE